MASRAWVTRANIYLKYSFPLNSSGPQLFFCSSFSPFKYWNNDIFSDFAYLFLQWLQVFYTFISISLVYVTDLVLEMGWNRNKHQKSWDPYLILLACLIYSPSYFWSLQHFFKFWLYFYIVLSLRQYTSSIPPLCSPIPKGAHIMQLCRSLWWKKKTQQN